jgi:predicted pyridoxine 5'-phosphate oxidase superfamily flavin-nucleotide-binding protein
MVAEERRYKMAKLTEEMKALVASQQAFIATASPDGVPNIGPKASTRVLDDEHIVFYELAGGRTWDNLQKNPSVAIAVADLSTMQGYRFVGKAELLTEGELYEGAKALAEMLKMPNPAKAAVKVKVEEIYDLGAGGLKVT